MPPIRFKLLLFAAYFMFGILLNSVGTVILQSIASFGVTKLQAGTLEGFKDLPIAIMSILVASRLPAFGYRRAMATAFAMVAAACVAMVLLPAFTTTQFLFLMFGVSFALVKISVYATIGLLTRTPNAHASLMNTIEGVFMLGVLSGYWVFSGFIDHGNPASLSWLNVYWVLAIASAIICVLFVLTPYPTTAAGEPDVSPGEDSATIQAMLALALRPMVMVFLISAFLYVLIEQGIGTWLPTFNNEVLHLSPAMSIQATSIFALGLAVGRLTAGLVVQRVDWYWMLVVCVVAMGALVLFAVPLAKGLSPDPEMTWASAPLAAFVLPLVGFFMAPIYPAINSVVLSALPRRQHAGMAGLIIVFSALGGTTGSLLTGFAFERLGGITAFYGSLVPMAAIIATLTLLKRMSVGRAGEAGAAQG